MARLTDLLRGTFAFFGQKSPYVVGAVAVRGLISVAVYKIISLASGPAGLTLFSHFQNLVGLFTAVPDQGTNLGVMSLYLRTSSRKRLFYNALLVNLLIFAVIGLLVFLSGDLFLRRFQDIFTLSVPFYLLLLAVFCFMFNSLTLSFIYATESFRWLLVTTLINAAVVIASVATASAHGIYTVMAGFVIGWGFNSIFNLFLARRFQIIPPFKWKMEPGLLKSLSGFMLLALASLVFGKLVDFMVREFAIQWFGVAETGYWQSQVRLSDSYRSAFLGTVGLVFYARINKLRGVRGALGTYSREVILKSVAGIGLVLLLLYLLRKPVFLLLYSREFFPATEFLEWQLLADVFALPSFLLAYLLAAHENFRAYLQLHLLSALAYLLLIALMLAVELDVAAFPKANFIRFLFFSSVLYIYCRKKGYIH